MPVGGSANPGVSITLPEQGWADGAGGAEDEAPTVLLLGGLGMVGLHLLQYLVDFRLAAFVRVVDRRLPSMCHLSAARARLLCETGVEFVQADLSLSQHVQRAFSPHPQHAKGAPLQVVVNVAAETTYALMESIYARHILRLRQLCATTALTAGCERYIEVSTTEVFGNAAAASFTVPPPPPHEEEEVRVGEASTLLGHYHGAAEAFLRPSACADLPWSIVRLPIVYGLGGTQGLMQRVACTAVHAFHDQTMQCLREPAQRQHTVHSQDAAAGIWHVVCAGAAHECYLVVDDHDSTQGRLNEAMTKLFPGLRVKYASKAVDLAAQHLSPKALAHQVNADHLEMWEEVLRYANISQSSLSPYLHPEQLSRHHIALQGSKLKALGFTCSCPHLTPDLLRDGMEYWMDQRLFPPLSIIAEGE